MLTRKSRFFFFFLTEGVVSKSLPFQDENGVRTSGLPQVFFFLGVKSQVTKTLLRRPPLGPIRRERGRFGPSNHADHASLAQCEAQPRMGRWNSLLQLTNHGLMAHPISSSRDRTRQLKSHIIYIHSAWTHYGLIQDQWMMVITHTLSHTVRSSRRRAGCHTAAAASKASHQLVSGLRFLA